jgi:hypothetical protein
MAGISLKTLHAPIKDIIDNAVKEIESNIKQEFEDKLGDSIKRIESEIINKYKRKIFESLSIAGDLVYIDGFHMPELKVSVIYKNKEEQ